MITNERGTDTYEGDWKDDKRDGKGKMKYGDFEYEGDWKDDKRDGKGIAKYLNGEIYEGEWERNMRHGKGMQKNKNGHITQTGKWIDDRFVEDVTSYFTSEFGGGKTTKRTRKHRKTRKLRN